MTLHRDGVDAFHKLPISPVNGGVPYLTWSPTFVESLRIAFSLAYSKVTFLSGYKVTLLNGSNKTCRGSMLMLNLNIPRTTNAWDMYSTWLN